MDGGNYFDDILKTLKDGFSTYIQYQDAKDARRYAPVYQQPTTTTAAGYPTPSAVDDAPMNWTKWGVIFGAISVFIAGYAILRRG